MVHNLDINFPQSYRLSNSISTVIMVLTQETTAKESRLKESRAKKTLLANWKAPALPQTIVAESLE